jgi:NAD-dependent dihydropyrimidine dehydrogenase PreA subunit
MIIIDQAFCKGCSICIEFCRYVRYHNGARPSQAIHGIPDPYLELQQTPPENGKLVALPVLGGIHHDYRLAA